MKGSFFLVLAISVTMAMAGCTATQTRYAVDATVSATQAQALKTQYVGVRDAIRNKQEESSVFSDEEWRELGVVTELIDGLINEYSNMASLKTTSISVDDVRLLWSASKEAYSLARDIVSRHLDEFTATEQVKLLSFDRRADSMNDRITRLLDNESYENINHAVSMVASVVRLSLGVADLVANK